MKPYTIKQWRVRSLKESPAPQRLQLVDTPKTVAEVWERFVMPEIDGTVETAVAFFVNTRRRLMGWSLMATGTLDTLLIHPREVFRAAIVSNASAVIMAHNHPSGDSAPSEADIKVTRDLIRAGKIIKIELLDHVVIGHKDAERPYVSLRELGYFYSS